MSENRSDRVFEVANYSPWPRETRERLCPHCRSGEVTPTASIAGVRVNYRCHECSKEFVLLHGAAGVYRKPGSIG
jgi:hypothetical protein